MTKLLEKAFREISQLRDEDQDRLALLILSTLQAKEKSGGTFGKFVDKFGTIAKDSLKAYREGRNGIDDQKK